MKIIRDDLLLGELVHPDKTPKPEFWEWYKRCESDAKKHGLLCIIHREVEGTLIYLTSRVEGCPWISE